MKQDLWRKLILAALCAVVALGMIGCDDDDDDPPASIAGAWALTISGSNSGGPYTYNESMTIVQNGSAITGSYTYDGAVYTISGTYDNGRMVVLDSDGWTLNISFSSENSGSGQATGVFDSGVPGTETFILNR